MSTSAERMRRLRERQKNAGAAVRALPKTPDELILPAVDQTLAALELGPKDAAAAQLARQYAATIDQADNEGWAMRWIAPHLLAALDALGATPSARARIGVKPPAAALSPSWLELQRQSRDRRHRA